MNPIIEKMIDSAAGVIAAAIVGCIWLNLAWLWNSKRNMEKILSEIVSMRSNISILYRLQGPVLLSLKASLEAQRDGHCNGNVDKALEMIDEEKKKFDEYLIATIAGEEAGENKK
jgi:hypothetical protein